MIVGDKIAILRKQSGWSQEELAQKLEISRQSVSKWESGASIPDLDKILKLSSLFGVSTDYLLKDEIEETAYMPEEAKGVPDESGKKEVSLQEAVDFMETTKNAARWMCPAISACILSPVCLIFLGGLSEYKNNIISENMAGGIGLIVLIVIVAAAVSALVINGMKLSRFEYLEKEAISLQYGVRGIVEKRKEEHEGAYRRGVTVGVALCIISVIPLFAAAALELGEFAYVCCVCILLIIISAGVFSITNVGIPNGSFDKLLQTGDYTEEKKELNRRISFFAGAYWCLITAIYLGISLWKDNWDVSWIIWPVAAVLFAALHQIAAAAVRARK